MPSVFRKIGSKKPKITPLKKPLTMSSKLRVVKRKHSKSSPKKSSKKIKQRAGWGVHTHKEKLESAYKNKQWWTTQLWERESRNKTRNDYQTEINYAKQKLEEAEKTLENLRKSEQSFTQLGGKNSSKYNTLTKRQSGGLFFRKTSKNNAKQITDLDYESKDAYSKVLHIINKYYSPRDFNKDTIIKELHDIDTLITNMKDGNNIDDGTLYKFKKLGYKIISKQSKIVAIQFETDIDSINQSDNKIDKTKDIYNKYDKLFKIMQDAIDTRIKY